jgi:hypothetical protein
MEPLVRFIGMAPKQEKLGKYREYKALLLAYRAELQALNKMKLESRISEAAYENWRDHLQHEIATLGRNMEDLQLSDSSIDEMQDRDAKVQLLQNRKDYLNHLVKEGILTQDSAHHLALTIDSELESIIGNLHGQQVEEKVEEAKKVDETA